MNILYTTLPQIFILGHVCLAMLLGAIIGIDRELAHRPAGLRTHTLVSGSAALLVSLSQLLVTGGNRDLHHLNLIVRSDPVRIIEAIITGVSFIGTGTIIRPSFSKDNKNVQGLTTAASLLYSAGIGICVALRQYLLAISLPILVIFVIRAGKRLRRRYAFSSPDEEENEFAKNHDHNQVDPDDD